MIRLSEKWHIGKNGKPERCNAEKVACPRGGDHPHFDNESDAKNHKENYDNNVFGATSTLNSKSDYSLGSSDFDTSSVREVSSDDQRSGYDVDDNGNEVYVVHCDKGSKTYEVDADDVRNGVNHIEGKLEEGEVGSASFNHRGYAEAVADAMDTTAFKYGGKWTVEVEPSESNADRYSDYRRSI